MNVPWTGFFDLMRFPTKLTSIENVQKTFKPGPSFLSLCLIDILLITKPLSCPWSFITMYWINRWFGYNDNFTVNQQYHSNESAVFRHTFLVYECYTLKFKYIPLFSQSQRVATFLHQLSATYPFCSAHFLPNILSTFWDILQRIPWEDSGFLKQKQTKGLLIWAFLKCVYEYETKTKMINLLFNLDIYLSIHLSVMGAI